MLHWVCIHFNDLSPIQLYEALRLRSDVFVVEQSCPYPDADGNDDKCHHLMGYANDALVAYARLISAHVTYPYISIGRVVSSPAYRRRGAGKELMQKAIAQCFILFGEQAIKIGAQLYLKRFYESFGFRQCAPGYDEDGIPHIPMLREV